jgi:hypothetical protein
LRPTSGIPRQRGPSICNVRVRRWAFSAPACCKVGLRCGTYATGMPVAKAQFTTQCIFGPTGITMNQTKIGNRIVLIAGTAQASEKASYREPIN